MDTTIRAALNGGTGSDPREVESITNCPPADGLLADMTLAEDQTAREALAREAAITFGREIADNTHKGARLHEGLAVAAMRAGHSPRSDFADDLYGLCAGKAWPERKDERSAQALARAEAEIDAARAKGRDMLECLVDVIERLGGESDVDLDAETPALVARAGLVGEKANAEVKYLLRVGRLCREAREERAYLAYLAERDERRMERLARKKAGLSRFATYPINVRTGRAVADEDFEAAEVARAEREHVEAVTQSGVGLIAEAAREGADLGTILVEVFVASCRTRDCPIDAEAMTARFVEAAGDLGLSDLFDRTLAAGRACSGPAETEAAFSRLLAAEGIAAPFSFAPEPAQSSFKVAVPPATAHERRLVAAALAEIGSNRNRPAADLMAIARRVGHATTEISAEDLAAELIAKSGEVSEYMRDAIRLSVSEARQAGPTFEDAAVEARVDRMLKAVHAPITGEPGLVERNAREVAKAMSPVGATGPTVFKWEDPDSLPRRKWLYGFLQRGEFCLTYAVGGVGKTALWIVEALALVSGKPVLGILPNEGPGRVWCYSGEEPMHEMKRRVFAACKHYGLGPDDLGDRLFVDNFETCDFVIAEQIRDGVTINKPRLDLLVNYLVSNEIDVLFIDPFISVHHVNENDNSAIQQVASAWKEVATRANVAIHIAHHSRKGSGQDHEVTQEDARGARALIDKSRGVRPLGSMSRKQAEDFGIPVEDRRRFFYYDPTEGKPNAALASGKKQWFRTESVFLGAGRNGDLDRGESVGVVERWWPPAPTDKLDENTIESIRMAVGGRCWRAANNLFRKADSIGAPIAEALGLDPNSSSDMRRIKDAYAHLLKGGFLSAEEVPDQRGVLRPYARWADED